MAYLDKIIAVPDSTSADQYLTFVSGTSSAVDPRVDTSLKYNPGTDLLTIPNESIIGNSTVAGNVSITKNLTVTGDLIINGTTTTVNTTNLVVTDKNIILGNVGTPSDTTADGGGITLKGATDKFFQWNNTNSAWDSSESLNLASGKILKINNVSVLSSTTLGSTVTSSSLTKVGLSSAGFVKSDASGNLTVDTATYLTSSSLLDAGKLSHITGNIPSALLGNSSVYIGNTAIALNRGTGLLSLTGVNIDGNAGYATTAGSTTYALTAGNGLTGGDFKGNAATTFAVVSAAGTADTVGQMTITADAVGVTLGTNSVTAAKGDHTHAGVYQPAFTAGNAAEVTSSVLTIANGTGATLTNLNIQVKQSNGTQAGYLSAADWLKFNNAATNAAQWDGGSTGLVAATGRTSLGATTVGSNIFTLTNPSAIRYLRTNADNTVTAIDGATLKAEIGLGNVSSSVPANTLVLHTTGATNVTFPTTGTLATTSQLPTVNDGALALTVSAAASGQGVVLGVGTGFTANEPAGTITYDIDVGPALTNLATIMNGATTGFLKKTSNDIYALDSTVLTSASTLSAGNLSGVIPGAVLANSSVYIGNTSIALNRGTGLLLLTGVNIDGNAGYATSAGSTTYSLSAGNGLTGVDFNGNAATTFAVASAAGTAGSVGTIVVTADAVGVSLGTTSTTAAAGNHVHGNITTDGKIGSTSGLMVTTTTAGALTTLAAGTTAQYLRGDGTWGTPPDTNTDTLQSITNTASGTYFISFVAAATGNLGGYVRADGLTYNAGTNTLSAGTFSGAFSGSVISAVTTITSSTYAATSSYPIILADATTPASITIGLPAAASSNGLVFRIKKIDGSAHQVIIDANGTELIDGAETFTLIYQYQAVDLACNGTAWYIL